jgi:hypothetical protein
MEYHASAPRALTNGSSSPLPPFTAVQRLPPVAWSGPSGIINATTLPNRPPFASRPIEYNETKPPRLIRESVMNASQMIELRI